MEILQGEKFEMESLLNAARNELAVKKDELEKTNDDNKKLQVNGSFLFAVNYHGRVSLLLNVVGTQPKTPQTKLMQVVDSTGLIQVAKQVVSSLLTSSSCIKSVNIRLAAI